jgi:hypothetical protein
LLAAHAAIKHFHHFCEGCAFKLWTDLKHLVTALSRVPVPILLRQQRHLAFISKFIVQMLYLPGLKNVIADFLSPPLHLSCLELSLLWQRQIQLNSKPWPLSKIVVQKRSVCLAVHLYKLRSDKQACLAMFQLAFSTPLSQQNLGKTYFCICTISHTLGGSPPSVLFLLNLFGTGSPTTSTPGQDPACTANSARSTATPACCRSPSPSLNNGLLTFTSTLQYSNNCNYISSLLIAHPNEWKPFRLLRFPLRCVHKL